MSLNYHLTTRATSLDNYRAKFENERIGNVSNAVLILATAIIILMHITFGERSITPTTILKHSVSVVMQNSLYLDIYG